MTVRNEFPSPIPPASLRRNAPRPAGLRSLAGSRARRRHAGAALLAATWMLALAFFVLAVAAPAAVMERQAGAGRAGAVAARLADVRR